MAEKRYKSFVVIGDDDAKTTRVFFYIGSGKNRSAEAMKQNALDYYEEHFQNTWFPEISNQRNYNSNPQEFDNIVQAAVADGTAEYTKIPNFGDRWIITPKAEETPTDNGDAPAFVTPERAEWYTPSEATVTSRLSSDEDDRVGLPDDEDDYEEDSIRASADEDFARKYDPALIEESELDQVPGENTPEIQHHSIIGPGGVRISYDTIGDPVNSDGTPFVSEHPADVTTDERMNAIGGFHMDNDKDADTNKDQGDDKDTAELPTQEEMEAEIKELRENPSTTPQGNTGRLRATSQQYVAL